MAQHDIHCECFRCTERRISIAKKKEKRPLAKSTEERRHLITEYKHKHDVKKAKRAAKKEVKHGRIRRIDSYFR